MIKKYCEGLDCMICNEKEPCIYKIANKLAETLDTVENVLKTIMETNRVYPLQANLQRVLDIINKAKENN